MQKYYLTIRNAAQLFPDTTLLLIISQFWRVDMKKKNMTKKDASRIQSAEANKNNGQVSKGSFAARAQSTAAKRRPKSSKN